MWGIFVYTYDGTYLEETCESKEIAEQLAAEYNEKSQNENHEDFQHVDEYFVKELD
jgi:hypothetical protein